MSCELDQYADDSTLTSSKDTVEDINEEMNENCEMVSKWMEDNELCLNADKTHLMVGGTGRRLAKLKPENSINITMDGFQLKESEEKSEKLLGVKFQSNLKWHKQIQELQLKLKDRLTGLTSVRFIVAFPFRKTLAEGIF